MALQEIKTFFVAPDATGNGLTRDDPGGLSPICELAHHEARNHYCRVILLDGEYKDPFDWEAPFGREEHSITIEAERPHCAVFVALAAQTGRVVRIERANRITFRGLAFRQSPEPSRPGANHFKITEGSRDIHVDNCTFTDLAVGTGCLTVAGNTKRVMISRCIFANQWPQHGPIDPDGSAALGNHMIYISESSQVQICRCHFYNNWGGSYVKLKLGSKNCSVFDCEFVRTRTRSPHDGDISTKFVQINNNETPKCKAISVVRNTFINLGSNETRGVWRRGSVPEGTFSNNISSGNMVSVNPSP